MIVRARCFGTKVLQHDADQEVLGESACGHTRGTFLLFSYFHLAGEGARATSSVVVLARCFGTKVPQHDADQEVLGEGACAPTTICGGARGTKG